MKHHLIIIAILALAFPAVAETQVIVDQASLDIFPESWRVSPINAEAELLPEDKQTHFKKLLENALKSYPDAVLEKNLKKVYALGLIRYSGVAAGGTNSRSAVYVVSNERYSDERFLGNFHAEFSSILLRNHADNLDTYAWKAENPEGFEYLGSGVKAVTEKQSSLHLKDELHEEGFLHQYGKASVQEDFNSFAARLWIGDKGLWSAIEKFPRIKAKADLAIAFYTKLDPTLTFEFFNGLPRTVIK